MIPDQISKVTLVSQGFKHVLILFLSTPCLLYSILNEAPVKQFLADGLRMKPNSRMLSMPQFLTQLPSDEVLDCNLILTAAFGFQRGKVYKNLTFYPLIMGETILTST